MKMLVSWPTAATATLHCLTGCAIGEILGMVISTFYGWKTEVSVILSIALAFFFGYLLTLRNVLPMNLGLKASLGIVLAADTVSIAVMEITDNAIILAIPNAINAELTSWLFWSSLLVSLLVAFIVALPINRFMISRGKGHALVHHH